jgi:thiol-disulfide isomerase/thioredoxin
MRKTAFMFLILGISFTIPALSLAQKSNDRLTPSLKMLDYPQSLTELLKQFKGKVVYIDLMASWCKPCIVELKESKKLRSYFEENNIVKLYITIDGKEDIGKAFSLIQNDTLSGYFTSYHPVTELKEKSTFPKDIETLFLTDGNGNLSISIPKYAIVNKKGEIVEKRAERPSNFLSLKEQLEKYF